MRKTHQSHCHPPLYTHYDMCITSPIDTIPHNCSHDEYHHIPKIKNAAKNHSNAALNIFGVDLRSSKKTQVAMTPQEVKSKHATLYSNSAASHSSSFTVAPTARFLVDQKRISDSKSKGDKKGSFIASRSYETRRISPIRSSSRLMRPANVDSTCSRSFFNDDWRKSNNYIQNDVWEKGIMYMQKEIHDKDMEIERLRLELENERSNPHRLRPCLDRYSQSHSDPLNRSMINRGSSPTSPTKNKRGLGEQLIVVSRQRDNTRTPLREIGHQELFRKSEEDSERRPTCTRSGNDKEIRELYKRGKEVERKDVALDDVRRSDLEFNYHDKENANEYYQNMLERPHNFCKEEREQSTIYSLKGERERRSSLISSSEKERRAYSGKYVESKNETSRGGNEAAGSTKKSDVESQCSKTHEENLKLAAKPHLSVVVRKCDKVLRRKDLSANSSQNSTRAPSCTTRSGSDQKKPENYLQERMEGIDRCMDEGVKREGRCSEQKLSNKFTVAAHCSHSPSVASAVSFSTAGEKGEVIRGSSIYSFEPASGSSKNTTCGAFSSPQFTSFPEDDNLHTVIHNTIFMSEEGLKSKSNSMEGLMSHAVKWESPSSAARQYDNEFAVLLEKSSDEDARFMPIKNRLTRDVPFPNQFLSLTTEREEKKEPRRERKVKETDETCPASLRSSHSSVPSSHLTPAICSVPIIGRTISNKTRVAVSMRTFSHSPFAL